jgi:hypothetical protein
MDEKDCWGRGCPTATIYLTEGLRWLEQAEADREDARLLFEGEAITWLALWHIR